MRVLIQRVSQASVSIGGREHSRIGAGMVLLIGVAESDGEEGCNKGGDGGRDEPAEAPRPDQPSRSASNDNIDWLVGKVARLRIFDDAEGVMNLDVVQTGGEVLAISQFTLLASTRKGNRPSYTRAARPEIAEPLYLKFVARLGRELGREIKTGVFGADMQVSLTNDGPVTIWMDSENRI